MTQEDKASRIFAAADGLAEEYRNEGRNEKADRITGAFADLPRDSAARLFDILAKVYA